MEDNTGDFNRYMRAQDDVRRWRAEYNYASKALELARYEERMSELLSQHEPVATIDIDREKLRLAIGYIRTGRL